MDMKHLGRCGLIAALAALAWPAGALADAGQSSYGVVVAPNVAAGGASTTYSVTITDSPDSASRVGAVALTAPAGFQPTAAALPPSSPGTASLSGDTVDLQGLALSPGQSVTASVTAVDGCQAGSESWSSYATSEPDFTGTVLTLDPGSSSEGVTVVSACSLAFTSEPADADTGQTISTSALNPAGPPVTVEVLDGNGNPSPISGLPITASLAANPGPGTLSGTTTQPAMNGVASFADLSINQPGDGYELGASSPGLSPATSTPFNEYTASVTCPPGQSCSTSSSTPTSTLTVNAPPSASANTLTISVDEGTQLACGGYGSQDPNWYAFTSSSTGEKTITYQVVPSSAEHRVLAGFQFCLGAPYEFTSRSGAPAPPGTLPDGSSGYIGLLPNCPATPAGPCIASRTSVPDPGSPTGFDAILKVRFPAGLPGDPYGRV
jgi:hypothetical protein